MVIKWVYYTVVKIHQMTPIIYVLFIAYNYISIKRAGKQWEYEHQKRLHSPSWLRTLKPVVEHEHSSHGLTDADKRTLFHAAIYGNAEDIEITRTARVFESQFRRACFDVLINYFKKEKYMIYILMQRSLKQNIDL